MRTTLSSRFDVIRRLGAGGMGVVYEARDRKSGERLAIKTLHDREATALYRLKKEFRGLQNIIHPNLIQFRELIEEDGEWFLVMEFVEGCDARAYVRGHDDAIALAPTSEAAASASTNDASAAPITPPRDYDRLRDVIGQIAAALDHLHATERLHCDVKPANVVVDRTGRAVLLDLGLARLAIGGNSSTDGLAGTLPYVSPEQVTGAPASAASDCYALGVLLFELLTGRWPFTGTAIQILHAKCSGEAPTSLLPSTTPDDLRELCISLLRRDPAGRPSARNVVRISRNAEPASRPSNHRLVLDRGAFVGRARELATLHFALESVRAGNTRIVWVRGASGVGKSSLVKRFLEDIGAVRDVLTLSARCYEREDVPFKAIDGIIDTLSSFLCARSEAEIGALLPRHLSELCAAFPVLGRVPAIERTIAESRIRDRGGDRRDLAFAALREMFTRLGERRTVALFIDDLQWGDADSMRLLSEVLRPPDSPPLLMILGSRDEAAVDNLVANLEAGPAAFVTLDVGVLESSDASLLAQRLIEQAGMDASKAPTICAEANGHPLHIFELVKHAAIAQPGSGTLRLDDAIAARVGRLPEHQRKLLRLVCLSEGPITAAALQAAAETDAKQLVADTTALTSTHLLKMSAGQTIAVEPFHDRVREIVTSGLSATELRDAHARLARALQDADAPPERLAHHWAEAGETQQAALCAEDAAKRAIATLAFDKAGEWLAMALRLGAFDGQHRRALLIARAEALTDAGHPRDAGLAFLEASRTGEPAEIEQQDLRRRAAERLLAGGYLDEGLELTRALLDEVGLPWPTSQAATLRSVLWYSARIGVSRLRWHSRVESELAPARKLLIDTCWSTAISISMVDSIRGSAFVSRALIMALSAGEPRRIACGLAGAAFAAAGMNQERRLRRLTKAIARAVSETEAPEARCYVALADAARAFFVDFDFAATSKIALDGAEIWTSSGRGHTWEVDVFEQFVGWGYATPGDARAAAEHAERVVRGARRRGDRFQEVGFRAQYPHRYLLDDRAEDGIRDLNDALTHWRMPDGLDEVSNVFYWAWRSRAQLAMYSGRAEADAAQLEEGWRRIERSLLFHVPAIRLDAATWAGAWSIARAAEVRGTNAEAFRAHMAEARRCVKLVAPSRLPVLAGTLHAFRAIIAHLEGDDGRAIEAFRVALPHYDRFKMCGSAYAAKWRMGHLLGGDEGAALIDEARAWYQQANAVRPERMVAFAMPGIRD